MCLIFFMFERFYLDFHACSFGYFFVFAIDFFRLQRKTEKTREEGRYNCCEKDTLTFTMGFNIQGTSHIHMDSQYL